MGLGFIEDILKAPIKLTGLDKVFDKVQEWLVPEQNKDVDSIKVPRSGTNNPIPIIYGTREIGGIVVDRNVEDIPGGVNNEYLHVLVVWCAGTIDSIEEVYFNDIPSYDQRFKDSNNNPWFTVKHFKGDQLTADAAVLAAFNNADVNTKYLGIAYSHFRFEIDKEQKVWRGEPRIKAKIRGRKVYDPRTTSTLYSENPALCLYDYLRDPVWGKGLSTLDFIEQSIIDSANIADELQPTLKSVNRCVKLLPGDVGYPYDPSNPRYGVKYVDCTGYVDELVDLRRFTLNAIINTGSTLFNNIKTILNISRSSALLENGQIKLINEGAGDPVMFFNADNIIGNIKSTTATKRSRLNRVNVTFSNKLNRFKKDTVFYPLDSDPLASQWLAEDNGIRMERTLNYDAITEKAEALRMAEVAAKVSRDSGVCSFTAAPIAIKLQPGDVIGVDDETRGWVQKPFRATEVNRTDDGLVNVSCVEHNSTAYPWEQVDYDDTIGGTYLGDPAALAAPQNLVLSPDETLATLGALSWTYADDAFVKVYRIEIKDTVSGDIVKSFEERAKSTDVPLIPVGSYEISVYAVSTLGYASLPAVYALDAELPVAPDGILLTPGDFDMAAQPTFSGGLILGNQCEFALNSTATIAGRGANIVFTGLEANTPYTVFARTVNALGVSAWVNNTASTTDGTKIIEIVGNVDLSDLDLPPQTWEAQVAEVRDVFGDLINSYDNLVNEAEIAEESRVRNEQLAIVDADLISLNSNIDTLNNETIPKIQYDINYLNNVTLINVQSDLDNLNGVELPALQAQLDQAGIDIAANEADINTLNTVTLPALQIEIDNNESAINTLNTVTIPALDFDITANETAINTLNTVTIPAINSDISDNETAINTLNTVTIPSINSDISDNESAINTLNTVTIPAINSDIGDNETAINTLNTVTIPALEQDLTDLDDRFPIQTVDIGDDQISAPKILANAVTASKIIAGAVTTDKMTANSINGDRITANTLNASKITAGSITTDRMTANSIDGDRITANTLNADKIVAFSISTSEIAAGAVNGDRITANTLNADRIVAGSISTDRMTANTINGDRLLVNSLNADKIVAGSITTDRMTANTIDGDRILFNTLNGGKIIAGSITTNLMTANAINGDRITAGTLNADKIVANSITGGQIAADSIGADEIISNSITSNEIAANTITTAEIQAGGIEADRLVSNSITTGLIAAGAINAENINTNAVTSDKITADAVSADKIASDAIITRHIVADQIEGQQMKINSINTRELAAFSVTADQIDANAVTAGKINAGAVTTNTIEAGAVTSSKITVDQLLANEIFAEDITASGTISGATLIGGTVTAVGTNATTVPMYATADLDESAVNGGAAIYGLMEEGSGGTLDEFAAFGGAVTGAYEGSSYNASAIKGRVVSGSPGRAGTFTVISGDTCVKFYGGNNRCLDVFTFGYAGAHFAGSTDIGVLIESSALTKPTQAGLKVVETSAFAGVRSEGGTWDFYADNGSGSYGPFTGGHDGLVLKAFTAEQGDIICDGDVIAKNGVSDAILSMELSSKPMQKSCAGAFVLQHELNEINRPAAMKGLDLDDYSQYDAITFNALGEGLINVCGEGGDIGKGDYICTSSIAGKGMKQPQPDDLKSYTVAQARENVIFNSTTEVKQIAVIYKAG